jgi:hypothetical protein
VGDGYEGQRRGEGASLRFVGRMRACANVLALILASHPSPPSPT